MTKSTGKRQRLAKEETRRLILDAAYGLFEAKGYREATMRQIAAQAGVGLGTIFNHFPDKSFLLVEAFATDINTVVQEALATLPAQGIGEQLLHLAGALYGCYGQRPRLSLQIIGGVQQAEGPAGERLGNQVTEFLAMLAGLFEAAKARGELSEGVDCGDAALAFWSQYVMCLWMGLWGDRPDLDQALGRLERLVAQQINGLRCQER